MMLYHMEGIDYKDDPYDIDNAISDPFIRKVYKSASLICINSPSEEKAIKALRNKFRKHERRKEINFIEVIIKFKEKHYMISKYFFSDIGKTLQYKDSTIAAEILMHFTKKDIPCLCVYDSFLVKEKNGDELYNIMKVMYKKHMGYDIGIK